MRSLLNFIYKYHYFILFLLLEGFSVFLVVQYNNYQKASVLNSSNRLAGNVYTRMHNITNYFSLKEQNIALQKAITNSQHNRESSYKLNKVTLTEILDSVYVQKYAFVNATVINNSYNRSNNFLTLNVGTNQGVEREMAVISSNGIVGVVKDVSPNYSAVISVLNQNLHVSAMVKKSGYFGSLTWDGKNSRYAILHDLPNHIQLERGDSIVTSGYSAMFPKNELIGWVESLDASSGGDFLEVKVKLATDFRKLSHVMVVRNLQGLEQKQLEERSYND